MDGIKFDQLKEKGTCTEMYNFLKLLPKGGLLHAHLSGAIPIDAILRLSDKFYFKVKDGKPDGRLKYSIITSREWHRLKSMERKKKRGETFRFYKPLNSLSKTGIEEFREALIFRACGPLINKEIPFTPTYQPNPYSLPEEFEQKFARLEGISLDTQMMRRFLWEVLDCFWADNVEYIELMVNPFDKIKPTAASIEYALGKQSEMSKTLIQYMDEPELFEYFAAIFTLEQFVNQVQAFNAHLLRRRKNKWWRYTNPYLKNPNTLKWLPNQLNVRFLLGLNRSSIGRRERLQQAFKIVEYFQDIVPEGRYRNKVVGINLIGNEFGFVGRPIDYLKWMIPLIEEYPKVNISLHAGESSIADGHVFDSILLGAQRIGHGLSLQHSVRAKTVLKEKKICIEACVLSNKILGYIPDAELHPAKDWIKQKIKICLNTDDPGIFDTSMTDEFYYAAIAFDLSLAEIKKIAIESLRSSFMSDEEKTSAINKFSDRFDAYVRKH
jgi:adenosine deaminase